MKIYHLGVENYHKTWAAMQRFTELRDDHSEDELWLVEHPHVFTKGIADRATVSPSFGDIPVIQSDRGGQITYHGPGQLLIYCLIDIKRLGIGVKKMVSILETSVIDLLLQYDISAHLKAGSPGVYVNSAKIASLGLKVKRGKTYHGLSLNVDMDLSPFAQINTCGYKDLEVTQLADLMDNITVDKVAKQLSKILIKYVTNP